MDIITHSNTTSQIISAGYKDKGPKKSTYCFHELIFILQSKASFHFAFIIFLYIIVIQSPVLLKYGRPVANCDPWIHRVTQGPTIDRLATNGFFRFCKKCFGIKVQRQFHRYQMSIVP